MAFQAQAAPKQSQQRRSGGSGYQKAEFDPRPTPKDYMMASMNGFTTGLGIVQLRIQQGEKIEDIAKAVDEEATKVFKQIVARGEESPRAGFTPSQGTTSTTSATTTSTASAPAAAAPSAAAPASAPASAPANVPPEVLALPNADVVPPLGKYSAEKENKTLAQIMVEPAKRSHGVCWLIWFAGTDQKSERNIDFKNQVVAFLNAAEAQGMLPPDGTCE